jgi:hypothetical protein
MKGLVLKQTLIVMVLAALLLVLNGCTGLMLLSYKETAPIEVISDYKFKKSKKVYQVEKIVLDKKGKKVYGSIGVNKEKVIIGVRITW